MHTIKAVSMKPEVKKHLQNAYDSLVNAAFETFEDRQYDALRIDIHAVRKQVKNLLDGQTNNTSRIELDAKF